MKGQHLNLRIFPARPHESSPGLGMCVRVTFELLAAALVELADDNAKAFFPHTFFFFATVPFISKYFDTLIKSAHTSVWIAILIQW